MNTLKLSNNNPEEIDKFMKFLDKLREKSDASPEGMFSYFRKRPDDENDWYSWNIENWGSKWDVKPDAYYTGKITEKIISLSFDSAWAPPIALYEYLDNETSWIVVEANYHEPGMCFAGRYYGGVDECYDYSAAYDDTTELESIPKNILEYWCIRESIEENKEDNDNI